MTLKPYSKKAEIKENKAAEEKQVPLPAIFVFVT